MLPRRRLSVVARRRARATLANPYLRSNLRLQRLPPRPLAYRRRTMTVRGRRYTRIAPRRYVTYG